MKRASFSCDIATVEVENRITAKLALHTQMIIDQMNIFNVGPASANRLENTFLFLIHFEAINISMSWDSNVCENRSESN